MRFLLTLDRDEDGCGPRSVSIPGCVIGRGRGIELKDAIKLCLQVAQNLISSYWRTS